MSARFENEPEQEGSPTRIIAVAVLGVLAVGGTIGLVMNRTTAPAAAAKAPGVRPTLASASNPVLPQSGAPAADAPQAPAGSPTLISIRSVETVPPPNPFEPVRSAAPMPVATPVAAPKPAPAQLAAAPKPAARPAAAAPGNTPPVAAAAQPAAAPANAPKPEELLLTGIIHGEPPLAVMSFGGQSLFLKIGDQVADTWRLVEIKERSAIFQLGAQRVEVPIKGGSSE